MNVKARNMPSYTKRKVITSIAARGVLPSSLVAASHSSLWMRGLRLGHPPANIIYYRFSQLISCAMLSSP